MIRKLFIRITNYTFIRFLLVGGLNTAFGYSIYALLLYAGIHFSIASLISTCLGVLFNFQTIGRLVFKNDRYSLFLKFAGVYLVVYLAGIGCLEIFNINKVNMYIAGAILIFPMAALSFCLNKLFVFTDRISKDARQGG
ncbi:MAG: GtrA family protein [Desulfosporosinus sp.]|nr:GtrA family protein [Desulfosporosinus sp.]